MYVLTYFVQAFSDSSFRRAVLRYLVTENISFNTLESDAWQSMVKLLRPGTKTFGRDTMRAELDSNYSEMKIRIKEFLQVSVQCSVFSSSLFNTEFQYKEPPWQAVTDIRCMDIQEHDCVPGCHGTCC